MPTKTKKRPLTAEDLYAFVVVEDPQLSPDGTRLAFVRVTIDKLANVYKRSIWLATLEDGRATSVRPFTFGGKSDSGPRWSPDGQTLAFTSARGDQAQIYLIRMDGGEARALTAMPHGAGAPVWRQDGKRLAFLASVNAAERAREDSGEAEPPPATSLDAKHKQEREAEAEKAKIDPRVITRLPYRTGTEFIDDRRRHIYVIDVPAADALELPKPRRITEGELDFGEPAWTGDGRAVLATQPRDPEYDPWDYYDLVRVEATGVRRPFKRLTQDDHHYGAARVSPDGRWVAVRRQPSEGTWGKVPRLALAPAGGGPARDLTLSLDRTVQDFHWSADGTAVYFMAESEGVTNVYRVNAAGEPQAEVVAGGARIVTGFSVGAAGQVAFTAWAPDRPADLYLTGPGGQGETRLTDFNRELLAAVRVAVPEELRYAAPDGREIHGWVFKPVGGASRTKTAPLVVHMHGGPHLMWGPSNAGMWLEWQLHAARGYGVFFCNPRGADGYGEVFAETIHRDWGDHVMRDILTGVDRVVAQGWVDAQRLALTGGSYAGYLTAWIVGHDQRFACAWAQRGLYSLLSFFGTSDIPQLIEREFDLYPFDDVQAAWAQSPLAYVRGIRTPLVIEHQDQDYRCPIAEAEQLYAALKRLKREVVFIRYPREGHEMSRSGEPRHRVDRLNRMVDWFDRYCLPPKRGRGHRRR